MDETGWRLKGGQRALWGAFTERHAVLAIAPSRHEDHARASPEASAANSKRPFRLCPVSKGWRACAAGAQRGRRRSRTSRNPPAGGSRVIEGSSCCHFVPPRPKSATASAQQQRKGPVSRAFSIAGERYALTGDSTVLVEWAAEWPGRRPFESSLG